MKFFQSSFSALLALVDRHEPWASAGGKAIAQGTAAPGHRAQGEGKAVPACCLRSALPPSQVDPYLPYEYTCEGMLERIHAYIQHQVGKHPYSPWGSIPVLLAAHVLPGEPSLLSHLPLGKQLLTQCSSPARDPRSQPCAASGLIAEGTRRWGLGESHHEPKMLGGLWKVCVGDAGAGSRPFCCRE